MSGKMKKFEDKVVVITGASSGIGLVTAKMLAGFGAKVYGLAINQFNTKDFEYMQCDVTNAEQIADIAKHIFEKEKHIDYLDLMGDEIHRAKAEQVREAYQNFIVNHRAYAKLVKMNEGRERRIDILRHELDELHQAGIQPGEETKLKEESRRLHKASRIREKLDRIYDMIGSSEEGRDALHQVQTAYRELSILGSEDPELEEIELERRGPVIISEEEFSENMIEYSKTDLRFYMFDGKIISEDGEYLDNYAGLIGEKWQGLGHDAGDEVYVRNDKLGADYRIIWTAGAGENNMQLVDHWD